MNKQRLISRKTMIQTLSGSAAGLLLTDPIISYSEASKNNVHFTQAPLNYHYRALEPIIDGMTMEIHYSRHAAVYCANLNKAVNEYQLDVSGGIESVLSKISIYPIIVRNNGGGHYNHELFWKCMKPGGALLQENKLKKELMLSFGSVENFQKVFSEVALSQFGSGWAWLIAAKDGQLKIYTTPNQDSPLMDISPIRGYPLLGLDLWEHAYYLKYQNRRAEYINKWWGIIDWDFVSQRYLNFGS